MARSHPRHRFVAAIALVLATVGCSAKPADEDHAAAERSQPAQRESAAGTSETQRSGSNRAGADNGDAEEALAQSQDRTARALQMRTLENSPPAPAPSEPTTAREAAPEVPPAQPASDPPALRSLAQPNMAPQSVAPANEPPPAAAGTAPSMALDAPEHLRQLPAGAEHDAEQGFATVQVFYATDRSRDPLPLSAYQLTGNRQLFVLLSGAALVFACISWVALLRRSKGNGKLSAVAAAMFAAMAIGVMLTGKTAIEKHGVTYNGGRGQLVRGICNVTVPDKHQRGVVERPSLLRFEFREDQSEHIVLTSAVELTADEFRSRLVETVDASPSRDLLVFIHGYNVGFEAAVQRTAQISVDLPFEGVPVCYSWPSQGSLVGYPVDENNVAWTATHLKRFLRDLVQQSGADSINVVAHSMGNRALTTALQQMRYEASPESPASPDQPPLFDRVVLAAPDVDADLFCRDLAPALVDLAEHVTLYASSDDQALIASKAIHGYPRAGESGDSIVVVPGVETIDVSGIDLSLLGHSYYGDSESLLRDLYKVLYSGMPASQRTALIARPYGELRYWELVGETGQMR